MASFVESRFMRPALIALSPSGLPPDADSQHKLDRLRELRAVIDSLHGEREARDPLLAWVVARERAKSP
jgi:hypothetical protein